MRSLLPFTLLTTGSSLAANKVICYSSRRNHFQLQDFEHSTHSVAASMPKTGKCHNRQYKHDERCAASSPWIDLGASGPHELRPDYSLIMGQCFNWKKLHDKTLSTTTIDASIILNELQNFFQLNHNLTELYNAWSSKCPRMKAITASLQGVRVVQQNPWECLVSFICSSNNNIKRITLMLDRLRCMYGSYIATVEIRIKLKTVTQSLAGFDSASNSHTFSSHNSDVSWNPLDQSLEYRVLYEEDFITQNNSSAFAGINTARVLAEIQSPSKKPHPIFTVSPNTPLIKKRRKSALYDEETLTDDMKYPSGQETVSQKATKKYSDDSLIETQVNKAEIFRHRMFSFPTVDAISRASEQSLRALGMGYRAKFILNSAKQIQALGGESWLWELSELGRLDMFCNSTIGSDVDPEAENQSFSCPVQAFDANYLKPELMSSSILDASAIEKYSGVAGDGGSRLWVQNQLMRLPGVGRKVADCVALFSLNQPRAIPVDTHVWDIAVRDYDPTLAQCKSLTPTVYERVGDLFRDRFGSKAGWAHSVLFAAELPQFKILLPTRLQDEMKTFSKEQAVLKSSTKATRAK